MKSPLKWPGSKAWFVEAHADLLPSPASVRVYRELSAGGASVFFGLYGPARTKSVVADLNGDLVTFYRVLRDHCGALCEGLRALAEHPYTGESFYAVRTDFNAADKADRSTAAVVMRAAQFLYLIKFGMNGLCRYNLRGEFNGPFGKTASGKPPRLLNEVKLREASRMLAGVALPESDFDAMATEAQQGDFVYFDPPFEPLSETASFTSYTPGGFGKVDLGRVISTVQALDARGVRFALAQADTPAARKAFTASPALEVVPLKARRSINSDGEKRGAVGELLVRNYK